MVKFVPYEKCSKKEKRRRDAVKRNDWGTCNPVTRVAETSKKQFRRKQKHPQRYDMEA